MTTTGIVLLSLYSALAVASLAYTAGFIHGHDAAMGERGSKNNKIPEL